MEHPLLAPVRDLHVGTMKQHIRAILGMPSRVVHLKDQLLVGVKHLGGVGDAQHLLLDLLVPPETFPVFTVTKEGCSGSLLQGWAPLRLAECIYFIELIPRQQQTATTLLILPRKCHLPRTRSLSSQPRTPLLTHSPPSRAYALKIPPSCLM